MERVYTIKLRLTGKHLPGVALEDEEDRDPALPDAIDDLIYDALGPILDDQYNIKLSIDNVDYDEVNDGPDSRDVECDG